MTIYVTSEFLSLSATNSAKSAYCRFKYDRRFFSRYKLGTSRVDGEDSPENVTGQLLTKVSRPPTSCRVLFDGVQSLSSILKHRTVEKSVERCELTIIEGNEQEGEDSDTLESKLIVRLHCKHGIFIVHLIRTDSRFTIS